MQIKNIFWMLFMFIPCGIFSLSAKESVITSGAEAAGNGGTMSYTIGQVAYQTQNGTNGSVSQGVQQPFEISVVTGLEEAKSISLSVTAYPNPTNEYLTLKINENLQTKHDLSQLSFQLYDMNGKLLQNKKLTGTETQIDMNSYGPATYFIKVIVKKQGIASQEVKTFKIIKN